MILMSQCCFVIQITNYEMSNVAAIIATWFEMTLKMATYHEDTFGK